MICASRSAESTSLLTNISLTTADDCHKWLILQIFIKHSVTDIQKFVAPSRSSEFFYYSFLKEINITNINATILIYMKSFTSQSLCTPTHTETKKKKGQKQREIQSERQRICDLQKDRQSEKDAKKEENDRVECGRVKHKGGVRSGCRSPGKGG